MKNRVTECWRLIRVRNLSRGQSHRPLENRQHQGDRPGIRAAGSQAAERGVTVSEWCRERLLGQLKPSPASSTEEILLGEVIALRTILLNLQSGLASGEPLSRERMQELIEHADAGKLARARERLQAQAGKKAQGNLDGNGNAA